MEQIIKHFSPAMCVLAVGLLLIAIYVVMLATNGPIAQQMQSFIVTCVTSLTSAMPSV